MMTLDKIKIVLLTYSKNLLIASENHNWERYSELESNWPGMLKNAQLAYGRDLNIISSELISDNKKIQQNIMDSQKSLLSELEKNTQNTASIRSYLK